MKKNSKDRDESPSANAVTGERALLETPVRRRDFLGKGAALAGSAMAGALAPAILKGATPKPSNLPPNIPEWTGEPGTPIVTPPYGVPSKHESEVIRRPTDLTPTRRASWSFTPLQDLDGIITPNGLVFERHHNGYATINPEAHRFMVHGLVERPLLFTMDDIVRFPSVSRVHFLECSGNTLTEWRKATGESVQFTHGLLSCCEWTGVPLATVLQEAGVKPKGSWIIAEGADAAAMTRSIPMEKALDDALLVYSQNGERLRPEQGYPLRLFLPGYEGNTNIKWIRSIKVVDRPFMTREETSKYSDLLPSGQARLFTFIMEAKSVITFPSAGQHLKAPGFYEISGLAWSGRGRIVRVDVSVDGGREWHKADLQEPVLPKCLTRFRLPWQWSGNATLLQSRAVDETGYVQPTRQQLVDVRGVNYVYHYNAIQPWKVAENGRVFNVQV